MAQTAKYTQKDVNDVADAVMKNPGVPVDSTNFPDGMEQEVVNEIKAREQHHKDVQAAMDKMSPDDKAAAGSQPSAVDDIGKDTDPDHSAPMAGLLGASDSLTLGHTDELAGLIGAIDGNGYNPVRDAVREKQNFARQNHPWLYHGMGVLGGTQLPGGPAAGVAYGAGAGEGFSNKKITDPGMNDDVQGGALLGAALGPVVGGVAGLAKRGVSALAKSMAGDFWDPVLLRALFPGKGGSDAVTTMLATDATPAAEAAGPGAKEVTDVVRANSKFPYLSPQSAKDAIQVPKIAMGARGTIANPIEGPPPSPNMNDFVNAQELPPSVPQRGPGWTPQPGPPKEIDLGTTPNGWVNKGGGKTPAQSLYENASNDDLNGIMPSGPAARVPGRAMPVKAQPPPVNTTLDMGEVPPEIAPLSPAERVASQGLTNMSDAPSNGMDPSTMLGGASRMIQKNIVGPTAIGIPKAGQAMLRFMAANPGDYGTKAAALNGIINHVMSSADPSFSDYLAKETFPEYLALSLRAEKDGDNGRR